MSKQPLAPDIRELLKTAIAEQIRNPNDECFATFYTQDKGWVIMSARPGGAVYTPESYFKKFGKHPTLPHPENLDASDKPGRVVELNPIYPKPKGFSTN